MKCPRCSSAYLTETRYEGVAVDVCRQCKGVWLDEGELTPILKDPSTQWTQAFTQNALLSSSTTMPDAEKASVEPCPKCRKPMSPMNWGSNSGVIIDRCVGHGLWFDAQELEKIQAIHESWNKKLSDPETRAATQTKLAEAMREIERTRTESPERARSDESFLFKLLSPLIK